MKLRYTLLGLFTLLSTSTVALPAPVANAEPATGNSTVREVFKRAGAEIHSCTVSNTVALTFDDGPYIWNVRN